MDTLPNRFPTYSGRHAHCVAPDMPSLALADRFPNLDMDGMPEPVRRTHRRVVLDKPVNLAKRTVPNADTLHRSGLPRSA